MNTLEVRESPENGLSFELLVDGQPIAALLNDGNEGIPYWVVESGLPTWPPSGPEADPSIRLVSVCGCGEYGCGHTLCTVRRSGNNVVFENFAGDIGNRGSAVRLEFSAEQYESVSRAMAQKAQAYKGDA